VSTLSTPTDSATVAAANTASPARGGGGAAAAPAIECTGVWKQYYFYSHRPRKLKDAFMRVISRRAAVPPPAPVWALRDFNFRVEPGETVGVVGHNGAGKSTLLKLLSRILVPTKGTVTVNGRLSAIIELGAGFHEDLTARENVYLAASFRGLSRRDVNNGLYDRIVEFSELGEHMETPLKYFSSGMHARLGFAIAVSVNPDVLLIDEVLAVGDAKFKPKCLDAIKQFQHDGKAILFVSHDLNTVKSLCHRAIWMKQGEVCASGDPTSAINSYLEHYWPGSTTPKSKA